MIPNDDRMAWVWEYYEYEWEFVGNYLAARQLSNKIAELQGLAQLNWQRVRFFFGQANTQLRLNTSKKNA